MKRKIGIGASLAGMTGAHRSINPETNANFEQWCQDNFVPAMHMVGAQAALLWCLGGRADPGVDLDFDQMTSARIEGALTASHHALESGINAIAAALPAIGGELWYYLGMVEKSRDPRDPNKPAFHPGRQWTRMPKEVREDLVRQELKHYPVPARGRTGFVIDSGAMADAHSTSHEVAKVIESEHFNVGAEPLVSPSSWMHIMRTPTTSFAVAANLAQTEDHDFEPAYGALRPSTTGNVHTAVWYLSMEDWEKYGDRCKRWWDAGCSVYFSGDIALKHGATIRTLLAEVPQIPRAKTTKSAPKAVP
jgi:hypothetical protein